MIVTDASAAVSALLNDGAARRELASTRLCAPHLIDSEVASALRRLVIAKQLKVTQAEAALRVWRALAIRRYAANTLLPRIWSLRNSLSSYDATYVALAEALSCELVTADSRLAVAPGIRCAITRVPK